MNIKEALADYAHDAWSRWMKYLFSKSVRNDDGSVTIPKELVERWDRQVATGYDQLSEKEKNSDRAEADTIATIVLTCVERDCRLDSAQSPERTGTFLVSIDENGEKWQGPMLQATYESFAERLEGETEVAMFFLEALGGDEDKQQKLSNAFGLPRSILFPSKEAMEKTMELLRAAKAKGAGNANH